MELLHSYSTTQSRGGGVNNIFKPSNPFTPKSNFSKQVESQLTTDGPVVKGGASRVLGGRGEIRSQNVTERWVPPSAIKRDALPENVDDVKFRKVRSILNKLTPQTFDRLSNELLINVGLDTPSLLKGVILLIFEKALQEPKYVCMYAQLCKKLSCKVPNFDPPSGEGSTTFRRLLLTKCQDEYSNRARATAKYEATNNIRLSQEEEEEKLTAKRKMLGNIKFIGELGKLEMLTQSILHGCIEELVKKTKAEELECLCQILSTCGHLLDRDKGIKLMDQYFTRITSLSRSDKLPPRIRFMLQDVIELRSNGWEGKGGSGSRGAKESPKLLEDIRREAYDELGISDTSLLTDDFRFMQIDARRPRGFLSKKMTGMEDVFAPIPIGMSSLGTGPGVISHGEKNHGHENNGFTLGGLSGFRPSGGMRQFPPPPPNSYYSNKGGMNHNNNRGGPHFNPLHHNHNNYHTTHQHNPHYHHPNNHSNNHSNNEHYGSQGRTHPNAHNSQGNGFDKSAVAPRFRKGLGGGAVGGGIGGGGGNTNSPNGGSGFSNGSSPSSPYSSSSSSSAPHSPPSANGNGSGDEPSLRPPPHSMIKMFPLPKHSPSSSSSSLTPHSVSASSISSSSSIESSRPLHFSPPGSGTTLLPHSQHSPPATAGEKGGKKKGPTKEELSKKVIEILDEFFEAKNVEETAEIIRELKLPERLIPDFVTLMLNKSLDRSESERESVYELIVYLSSSALLPPASLHDSFTTLLSSMSELETDVPRIKSYVASFAARAISSGSLTLAQVGTETENGAHFPLFLLVLQALGRSGDKRNALPKLFEESKIDLMSTLPEICRTKDKMAEILEERELSFLFPLLKIQAEMTKQLQSNPSPNDFAVWIKSNVDSMYHTSQGFINSLMTVVFKFISQEISQMNESDQGEKVREAEKKWLSDFKSILSTYLQDKIELQVLSIYALQSAWFTMDCPKFILLRWFMNLYDMEIIEEEAFLKWKEDIRDDYPGKGKALFQVNQWLLWLEQNEEEEEDGEDELN